MRRSEKGERREACGDGEIGGEREKGDLFAQLEEGGGLGELCGKKCWVRIFVGA